MNWKKWPLLVVLLSSGCAATGHPPSTRANTNMDTSRMGTPESAEWDTPPKLLSGKAPIYPISQALSRKSGSSIIVYTIGADGRTKDFVVQSTTDKKYADHTIIALREWVYEPAIKGGAPIDVRVRQTFDFDGS